MADKKNKTRWSRFIIPTVIIIIFLILAYVFFVYILPKINGTAVQKQAPAAKYNAEALKTVDDSQSYGPPVNPDAPTGRSDPFAPI